MNQNRSATAVFLDVADQRRLIASPLAPPQPDQLARSIIIISPRGVE
jgi:hypothetical protein